MYREIEESQTLLINTQSKELAAQNRKIIKFGFGQSPFLPPKPVMAALEKAVHHKEYSSVQGDLALRKNMAQFHRAHNGLQVSPENILVAPGSKVLIYNILMAFEKADVFIPAPAWVSYAPQAKLAGHHLVRLETSFAERWRVSAEAIRNAAKSKQHDTSIMILNYPGNPDGLTYDEAELKAIAQAARALNILVISDEIYGLLDYKHAHLSFGNYYPERTITTTGLSKWCGAGGWRLGAAFLYDEIEPEFKQALIGIGSETYSCAPTPVQIAAREAYRDFEEMAVYLRQQTQVLEQVGNFCAKRLIEAGVNVHYPQGGFYIFPDFSPFKQRLRERGIASSSEMCQRLLSDTGVALLPASAFGFEEGYLAARLAFVDFEDPIGNHDFDLVAHGSNVVEGIILMSEWFSTI